MSVESTKFAVPRPVMWAGFLVAGCGLCTACKPTDVPAAKQGAPAKVNVVRAIDQELLDYQEFIGRTEPSETVEVRSRLTGFIRSVEFADGDQVSRQWVDPKAAAGTPEAEPKGQPLFMIEPDEFKAIHEQSLAKIEVWKAKRELAQTKLARSEKLIASNAVSREELDENRAAVTEAIANVVVAEADAARTALDLQYTVVRAEIDGQVDRALITPGNLVTGGIGAGTLLTRIVKNDPMHVYFDVDEKSFLQYLRRRSENDQRRGSVREMTPATETPTPSPAEIADEVLSEPAENRATWLERLKIRCQLRLADEKEFSHEGVLDFYENRIDSATARLRVRGKFANTNNILAGGMFVRIRVFGQGQAGSETRRAIIVPEKCIGYDQDVRFVYVIGDDGVPKRQTVELGDRRGEWRIVQTGLKGGEQVVYEGMQRIRRVMGGTDYEKVTAVEIQGVTLPEQAVASSPETLGSDTSASE